MLRLLGGGDGIWIGGQFVLNGHYGYPNPTLNGDNSPRIYPEWVEFYNNKNSLDYAMGYSAGFEEGLLKGKVLFRVVLWNLVYNPKT